MTASPPFFSVIVPAFDRARELPRTVRSVLAQDFTGFELLVIDDGSSDGTAFVARAFTDGRVRVLRHARNRGVGPARNTGIDAARGSWLVFLDSDDELAGSGALGRMAALAGAAPPDLHALWFRSRLDDGSLAPPDHLAPAPGSVTDWDYAGYLRFLERSRAAPRDMIRCVRREALGTLRYPDNRMLEEGFHLDFARRCASRLHPDVLRLYHADAPNQLTRRVAARLPRRDRGAARDRALGLVRLLARHGPALARHAPRTGADHVRRAGGQLLVAIGAVGLLGLAGCGTVDTSAMAPAPPVPAAVASLPPLAPYQIQPGDVLDIRLPLSPELDDEVTVRPDGHLSTTVIGDAPAAGLTVPALEAALVDAYGRTMRAPVLHVIVKQASTTRVYVAGQVEHPGEFRADGPSFTLSEALTLAGGPKLAGDTHRVFILRRGPDGHATFLRTRYDQVAEGTAPDADVLLAPYDVVFVPRTGIALGYEYFNQYLQQFVPVSWGFSYVETDLHPDKPNVSVRVRRA